MRTSIDIASLAGSAVNEDRAGAAGELAWVIDGATDVVEAPLTQASTDASWFAEMLDLALKELAHAPPADLAQLPQMLAEQARNEFELAALRAPAGRHEHPSATGVIVRIEGDRLSFVSIGDCALLVATHKGVARIGVHEDDAGDPWVADAIRAFRAQRPDAPAAAARADLWPKLRSGRAVMNMPEGYGVFSITETPTHFIRSGAHTLMPGAHVLLASDGLMRLVDVFRRYTSQELLEAIITRGLADLVDEVRALEREDAECIAFPRAKRHDDASGLLIRFED